MEQNRDNWWKCQNNQKRGTDIHASDYLKYMYQEAEKEKSLYWDFSELLQYSSSCTFSKPKIRAMD